MTSTVAHCPVCKDELELGLPLEISIFIAAGKAFEKSHRRRCRAVTIMGPVRSVESEPAPAEASNV